LADSENDSRQKRRRKPQLVRIGSRELETQGLVTEFWIDLYHRSMTVYWPVFFGCAALIFIALNAIFALLYSLGNQPIANVSGDRPLELFYFSIETLATVGYGDMHPQTNYGHLVATVEIFTGMCFLAVMTGLIFARISRPRARFVFAEHPVVGIHQGQPTLMIRVANARNNTISEATARLWLLRLEYTAEGHQFRRYHELELERHEHPIFSLSWTVFHRIDETSPLYGVTADDLVATDAALALNIGGIDDSSAQELHARKIYSHNEILWRHRYQDMINISPRGRFLIDYAKFHEVVLDDN
jgi:inward rectifier potassium channel